MPLTLLLFIFSHAFSSTPSPCIFQRHHSPDSTKVDAVESKEAEPKIADAPTGNGDASLPPPPSKWEKEDGAVAAPDTAKPADAELVTSSA